MPWKFLIYFNATQELISHMQVKFYHGVSYANGLSDALAKQGVNRVVSWEASIR